MTAAPKRRYIGFHLLETLYRRVKVESAKRGIPMRDLMTEIVSAALQRRRERKPAEGR